MSLFEIIETDEAPKALGPYSQAVILGNFIFLSGQIGVDPHTGKLVEGGIGAELDQIFKNITAVLSNQNLSLRSLVKLTIFITNLSDFAVVNDVMQRYCTKPYPARSTVEVSGLPKNALIEVEAMACS